jgi:hypothetical protein
VVDRRTSVLSGVEVDRHDPSIAPTFTWVKEAVRVEIAAKA